MNKYEEALERARMFKNQHPTRSESDLIDAIFPELAESEDERMRKHIIDIVRNNAELKGIPCDAEFAYLEKQKETITKVAVDEIRRKVYQSGYDDGYEHGKKDTEHNPKDSEEIFESIDRSFRRGREVGFQEGVESVKPTEWSEEDENYMEEIISNLKYAAKNRKTCSSKLAEECIHWLEVKLKSLRPQPHWKPSEEQMEALQTVYEYLSTGTPENIKLSDMLRRLYNDLKKL